MARKRSATAASRPARHGTSYTGLEAGQRSQRLRNFVPASEHINSLIAQAGDTVAARARWLVRNNGYANNAVDCWAADVVGAGIKPSSLISGNDRLREVVQELWLHWTDEADSEGITDFYGLERRAARESFISGECFLRRRPRRIEDGLAVPLQLQMLPSEMLPIDLTRPLPGRRQLRQGIEFDAIGRRAAYWFYRRHPNDPTDFNFIAGDLYTRVPAADVIHLFDPIEAGQIRGVSRIAAAVVKLFQIDAYDDAELERKKLAAMFSGFIEESGQPNTPSPIQGERLAGSGLGAQPIEISKLQPGTFQKLRPGEAVKFSEPAEVGAGYEPFQYRVLLAVCAALGMPYQAVTGDVLKANYSNIRASWTNYRRRTEAFQHAVMVFQLMRQVWRWWWEAAMLAGALPVRTREFAAAPRLYMAVKHIPPKWDWVDPLKDRQAEKLAVDNGFKARSDVIEAEGSDPEEVDRRIQADQQRAERLGLKFGVAAPAPGIGPPIDGDRRERNDENEERDDRSDETAAA